MRVDGARLALSWSAAPATWYRDGREQARYGQGRMIGVYGVAPLWVCIPHPHPYPARLPL